MPATRSPSPVTDALDAFGDTWWVLSVPFMDSRFWYGRMSTARARELSDLSYSTVVSVSSNKVLVHPPTGTQVLRVFHPVSYDQVRLLATGPIHSSIRLNLALKSPTHQAACALALSGLADWRPTIEELVDGDIPRLLSSSFILSRMLDLDAAGFGQLPPSVQQIAATLAADWDGTLNELVDLACHLDLVESR
jgi:hypothetical protein